MKLYTRLVDAGVFIFWSSDGEDTSHNLVIKIVIGSEKITLVDIISTKGQNYFSFDRVGSGDYEISLNAYRNGTLYQTETKNIKLISSVQKSEEFMEKLMINLTEISSNIAQIDSNLVDTYNLLTCITQIKNALTDPQTIINIRKRVQDTEIDNKLGIW